MSLLELRLQAATARMNVRAAKDAYDLARAEAEQRAIDLGAAGGKNAEERARSLTLALQTDTTYGRALRDYRQAEYEAERVEALLEAACDDRRNQEWQIRARLADALLGASVF